MTFSTSFSASLSLVNAVQPVMGSLGFGLPGLIQSTWMSGYGAVFGSVLPVNGSLSVQVNPGAALTNGTYTSPKDNIQLKDIRLMIIQSKLDTSVSTWTGLPFAANAPTYNVFLISPGDLMIWHIPNGAPIDKNYSVIFDALNTTSNVTFLFVGSLT